MGKSGSDVRHLDGSRGSFRCAPITASPANAAVLEADVWLKDAYGRRGPPYPSMSMDSLSALLATTLSRPGRTDRSMRSRSEGLLGRLGVGDAVRDQELRKDPRLLWVEIKRDDKAERIVIDFDVPVHETRADPRGPNDQHAVFRGLRESSMASFDVSPSPTPASTIPWLRV